MTSFHEEEILGKGYDSRLMKRLLIYAKPYWFIILLATCILLVTSVLELAGPYIVKIAIDEHIVKGDVDGLNKIVLLFIAVLFISFALQYFETYLMEYLGQKVIYDIRTQIFSHVQRLHLKFFDKTPVGRLITRVTTDVEALNEMFASGIVAIFGDIFTLLGIVVIMLIFNWKLALLTFSVLPLLFYAAFLFRSKVQTVYREIRLKIASINSFLNENITGMNVVQLFNREEKNFKQFDKINAEHMDAHIKSVFYYAVFFPAVELIASIAIALILWYGGIKVIENMFTLGALVAFIQYAQRFFRPIGDLSEKYNIMQSAMASSERIFKLLDTEPLIKNPVNPIKLEHIKGEIEFKNVWFTYSEDGLVNQNDEIIPFPPEAETRKHFSKNPEWVLKDVSFKIERGTSVALVGATGAGKSSIINLISRFYDVNKGEITIDGINIKKVNQESLRKKMAVVLQDVFLFSGNIIDNIRLGNKNISEKKVIESAKYVNAHQFIEKLQGGYYAEVKERGATLSVGQKQLLAFARALAFDPKILILDEATSSIDTETELLIQDALRKLMSGRTSIIIAHRLSTIQHVDKIIVLHKGVVRETGTHQQLLEMKGIYYKLYQLQYKEQELSAA
jgi:ATP-binding cassette subfamily B protein